MWHSSYLPLLLVGGGPQWLITVCECGALWRYPIRGRVHDTVHSQDVLSLPDWIVWDVSDPGRLRTSSDEKILLRGIAQERSFELNTLSTCWGTNFMKKPKKTVITIFIVNNAHKMISQWAYSVLQRDTTPFPWLLDMELLSIPLFPLDNLFMWPPWWCAH